MPTAVLKWNISPVEMLIHSRHDQGLVSRLAQESIDEHRGAGEVVNSPRPSFINTEPVGRRAVLAVKYSNRDIDESLSRWRPELQFVMAMFQTRHS